MHLIKILSKKSFYRK